MKKTNIYKRKKSLESSNTSTSLIARAGQIMAIIIALGLVSMISSMLVSESLSGDAAQINNAGALRMQAMRISRAHVSQSQPNLELVAKEVAVFEDKLNHLFSGGVTSARDEPAIEKQYQLIMALWQELKQPQQATPIYSFDQFVSTIDKLVTLLQVESEKKLAMLRLIQGVSLFSVLIVAFIVLFRLNQIIVTPLKQLVNVAFEVGKGNFNHKAEYHSDDELGVLANTINQMSNELESTYQDLEGRVAQKTLELTQSNRSLEVLYSAARNLATQAPSHSDKHIISELERVLGFGKISIHRSDDLGGREFIELKSDEDDSVAYCENNFRFELKKRSQTYGYLEWSLPKNIQAQDWQTQILQAMADIVATASELEQTRSTENRLLIVEERAVIARELHDSLAQSLSYLKVQMSLLTRKVQKDLPAEQLNETIDDIKQGLNKAYQQLRELLTTFRLKLEDPSIANALQGTATEFSTKCHHPVDLKFQLPQNYLSANQEIHVLQIVREALSNVHRHSQAGKAGISLTKSNHTVRVEIWDNGIGIPEKLEQQGHFGLGIMEERAKSLNALIDIQENKPQGTRVIVEFENTH